MKLCLLVGCLAIVALGTGVFVPGAAAQFGSGKPADDAEKKTLELYEAAMPAQPVTSPPVTPCRCLGESDAAGVAQINRALAQPLKSTGLDFTDEPLESVANFLQDEYDIPIQLDVPALDNAGSTRDEPITVNVRNISLRSALRLMLNTKKLTYVIRNEVLIITTSEVAEQLLTTCVYDVRDLATDGRSFAALAEAISSCIATETWAENGGDEAEMRPVQPGLLVISQTREVHEQVADLLAAIREMHYMSSEATSGQKAVGGAEGGHGKMDREPTPDEATPFD
jgi:hypothetical protein